mmetsp:Transcript_11237/g.37209  ORF Transcript_11237/g.37209 Transcript_11237/m.37209 type:complete len:227 (-) Transcript_11237:715-1395(-)
MIPGPGRARLASQVAGRPAPAATVVAVPAAAGWWAAPVGRAGPGAMGASRRSTHLRLARAPCRPRLPGPSSTPTSPSRRRPRTAAARPGRPVRLPTKTREARGQRRRRHQVWRCTSPTHGDSECSSSRMARPIASLRLRRPRPPRAREGTCWWSGGAAGRASHQRGPAPVRCLWRMCSSMSTRPVVRLLPSRAGRSWRLGVATARPSDSSSGLGAREAGRPPPLST